MPEAGKFRLHKFEQPIGEETYTITPIAGTFTLRSEFEFTDRGSKVPLTATLRSSDSYVPQSFVIKGKTSRMSDIDTEVTIDGAKATIRQGKGHAHRHHPRKLLHHLRLRSGRGADGDGAILARSRFSGASWRRCPRASSRSRIAVPKPIDIGGL